MTDTEGQAGNDTLLAGKYKTPQELEKAYLELQRKLGAPRQGTPEAAPLGGKPQEFESDTNGEVAKFRAKTSTALSKLHAGDPAAESELVALGWDRSVVRAQLGVAQDTQRRYMAKLHEAAGGKENYDALNEWITGDDGVESFERESYSQALASGDIQRSTEAIRHMTNKHREHTGYAPAQLTVSVPGGNGAKRIEAYSNIQEVGRATADPRYDRNSPRHDPAYAAEVQARMQISPCLDPGFAQDIKNR